MKYRLCPWVLQPCQSDGIHVISMTSTGLLKVGYGEIMREDVPVPWRRSSGPNAGKQGCQWRPCQRRSTVFLFFFLIFFFNHSEGDRHWLCAVWQKNNSRNKRSGSNGVKGTEWWSFTQCPKMNDAVCMVLFFWAYLLIMAGTLFFPLITVGDYTTIFSKAVFIKEHVQ